MQPEKAKKKPIVPGSSAFILDETAANLRTSKDAINGLNLVLDASIVGLNNIIDGLNNNSSYEDLENILNQSQPPPESPIDDSFRSSSMLTKSDWDLMNNSTKPELLLQQSERVVFPSPLPGPDLIPPDNSNELPVKEKISELPVSRNKSTELPISQNKYTEVHVAQNGVPVSQNGVPVSQNNSTKLPDSQVGVHVSQNTSPQLPETQVPRQVSENFHIPNPQPEVPVQKQDIPVFLDLDLNHDIKVKMEYMSHDRTLLQEDELPPAPLFPEFENPKANKSHDFGKIVDHSVPKSSKPLENKYPRLQKSPPNLRIISPKKSSEKAGLSDPSTLSPIKLVNGRVAPLTSPNVDLSFIPIAKSIDHNNHPHFAQEKDNESTDSGDDANNSFQAISTAIRKSFAGKTSMGYNSGPPSMHNDTQSETEVLRPVHSKSDQSRPIEKMENRSFHQKNIKVKTEPEPDLVHSPPDEKLRKSRSRSFNSSRYTASLFVSLPKKESIAIHPANKSRSEKSEKFEKSGKSERSEIPQEKTNQGSENDSNEVNQLVPPSSEPTTVPEPVVSTKDGQNSKAESGLKNIPVLSKEVPNLFSGNTFSKAFPPVGQTKKSPIISLRASPQTKNTGSSRPSGRFANRTTVAGSPVRRGPSERPLIRRSPVKSRIPAPPTVMPLSSSVNSSRSPTKYSHRNDLASLKGTPTNFLIHESDSSQKQNPTRLLPLHMNTKVAKGKSISSEKDFLNNRFLSTALLPDNSRNPRNLFRPLAGRSSSAKPFETGPSIGEANRLSRVLKHPVQPESNPKPKITLNLHPKQDLRPTKEPKVVSNRNISSPEKRDRSKMVKLQTSVTKGLKPLGNPSSTQSIPRKRAIGNAVPLPEEARGKVRKESTKSTHTGENTGLKTPLKTSFLRSRNLGNKTRNPGTLPDVLPDIPSDDEVLRSKKYLESWAETPEIMRVAKENNKLDPDVLFGKCAPVDMNDIFRQ